MKSSNKKLLQKIEISLKVKGSSSRGVIIYNPDYDQDEIFAKTSFFIALPDKRLDEELTKKIGKTFVFV
jgi:hypothetical protein